MEAMIQNDEEKEWMSPLLDIRNELAKLHPETGKWDDKDRRDFRRLNGRVQIYETHDGTLQPIPGPYTKEWREHWLRRVLETQTELREEGPEIARNIELIRLDEIREVRRIWLTDKHEFDDSVPRIYEEATGEPYPDQDATNSVLGPEEWALLTDVCDNDTLLLELMSRLLGTEQQFLTMSRRIGVYKELEKILNRFGFRNRQEAIAEALAHKEGQIHIDEESTNTADPHIVEVSESTTVGEDPAQQLSLTLSTEREVQS
jgi:DNA sulfur modification protein DndC